ncbi:unknown protein [Microcystis aeruginosa NIES-843]|uniref:Uncharacterized protein n=1 Tax=Microcystis aeruginosa (strain NIES-843 / IAM M-2473) TaxID=449447 RepID=B0JJ41_MICAN|nr:unknown protein [Microcystis aeruginosa NIES-843]
MRVRNVGLKSISFRLSPRGQNSNQKTIYPLKAIKFKPGASHLCNEHKYLVEK